MIGLALTLLLSKVDEPPIKADYRVCDNAYNLVYRFDKETGKVGAWAEILAHKWKSEETGKYDRKFFVDYKDSYRIQVNPKAVGESFGQLSPGTILFKVFRKNGEYIANMNAKGVEAGPMMEALMRSDKNPPP